MILFVDGGCSPNHGPVKNRMMTAVVTDEKGIMLVEKTHEGGSNNIAELWAVTEALMFAKSHGVKKVEIFTDSKNNLAWVKGKIGNKLNDKTSVLHLVAAITSLRKDVTFTLSWLPREDNAAGIYIENQQKGNHAKDASLDEDPASTHRT